MKNVMLFLLLVGLTFSCSSVVYYPNTANTPLFREKHEIYLSANAVPGGANLHAAYAPGKHLALLLNGSVINFAGTELETDYRSGQNYAEIAAGGFSAISSPLSVETYLGAGIGGSSSKNLNTGVLRTTGLFKAFLQLNTGFRWKYLTLGVSVRESFVHTAAPQYDGVTNGLAESDIFFEPLVFLGLGPEKFRVKAEAGLSYAHFVNLSYAPFLFSLGVETRFSLKK